jgi:DNA polymerase/3'-5' exonuclease PolX
MDNHEIARLLTETADLMEIAGEDGFRIRSYRNAASVLDGYPEPVSTIVKDPAKSVTDIPGIGKGIASAIIEIEQRGSFDRRDQMLELYPPTALELLEFPLSKAWKRSVRSKSCASCLAWAPSWKKRCCGRSRNIVNARAVSY